MQRGKPEFNFEQVYLDAKSYGIEEKLEDELYSFAKLTRDHYDFKLFLEDPRIAASYKKKCLDKISPKDMSKNFIATVYMLIDHGREELVESLSKYFTRRLFEEKKIMFGEVASAVKLPDNVKDKLTLAMKNIKNRSVKLRFGVNPKLIGGFTLKFINGEIWDASLRYKLGKIKEEILK